MNDANNGGLLAKIKNIRLLPPKDKRFYDLFNQMAEQNVLASDYLVKIFKAPEKERGEIEESIHSCFVRCSKISGQVEELLITAQQPPFERSEIMELVINLTRVIKFIKHAANRYVIYNFPTSDKEMRELAPVIHNSCLEIQTAIRELPHNRRLEAFYDTIVRYEIQADSIYHQGLGRRFAEIRQNRIDTEKMIDSLCGGNRDDCSPSELLSVDRSIVQYTRHVAIFFILREVYVELEKATDACTDVATSLKRMVTVNV